MNRATLSGDTLKQSERKKHFVRHRLLLLRLLPVLLGQMLGAHVGFAQSYLIEWSTIDAGAGTTSGGAYSLTGTIGQSDSGLASGGGYTLAGGYWGIAAGLQSLNAPHLTLTRNPVNGSITISWPRPATDFVLDQAAILTLAPGTWTQVGFPYQTNTTDISISVSAPVGNKFFRLRLP